VRRGAGVRAKSSQKSNSFAREAERPLANVFRQFARHAAEYFNNHASVER
jgi:hypothetical protein